MRIHVLLVGGLIACNGQNASRHDDSVPLDAAVGGGPTGDAAVGDAVTVTTTDGGGVPSYADTPSQVFANYDAGVISADGLTVATQDNTSVYVFTRASTNVAFPSSPTQTLTPSGIAYLGYGLSLSSDGGVLMAGVVTSATTSGTDCGILVYTRQGDAFVTTPQVINPGTPNFFTFPVLSGDGSVLAYRVVSGDISLFARSGSTFSTTPFASFTPPVNATTYFGTTLALSQTGATLVVGDPGAAAAYVYTGSPQPSQTLTPGPNENGFGDSVALRADGEELVEASVGDATVDIFERTAAGYVEVQSFSYGEIDGFGGDVSVALGGTLLVTWSPVGIYLFAP